MKEKYVNNLSREEVYERLKEITTFIKSDYEILDKELCMISETLDKMETFSLAYLTSNMVVKSIINLRLTYKCSTLKKITDFLEKLGEEYKAEFFQDIEFLNLVSYILSKENDKDIVISIWKTKEVLNVIRYQMRRIYKAEEIDKQIAILKGMIAMY